jgi:hypothetical protein
VAVVLPARVVRLARIVALAVIIGVGVNYVYQAVSLWSLTDATAYWNAAMRLREGAPLYPTVGNVEASDVYRYAPWFAWLTVPFTYLPIWVAGAIWSVILVAASVASVVPLAQRGAWIQVVFFFPILIGISAFGNVQALLVAALVWMVDRWSGPAWIGVAASLKIFPILLALTYVGRGQWWRALIAVGVAAILWAPALLYDLRGYVTESGQAGLFDNTVLWVVVALGSIAAALGLARTWAGWLASAVAVVLGAPRFFIYDVTYLQLGAPLGQDKGLR